MKLTTFQLILVLEVYVLYFHKAINNDKKFVRLSEVCYL